MILNIPDEDLPILHALMEMPKESFDALIPAIRESPPTISTRRFAEAVLLRLKDFHQKEQLPELLEMVSALYYMLERTEMTPSELAAAISRSAVAAKREEFEFPDEKSKLLMDRLTTLLSFDKSLGVTAKALDVMTENERNFCHARILSDIRPVFSSYGESASAALIVHNLQIAYHDSVNNEHSEIYFALDADDIAALKEVIERAEKKTKALEEILKQANVTHLEP